MTRHRPLLLAASLPLVLLAGCKQDAAPAAGNAASGMQAAIEQSAGDAADAGALPGGDAPLQPGQSVQGMIEADVGKGTQRFRSLSTKVADDIAEQLDDKLATRNGSQALEDANLAQVMSEGAAAYVADVVSGGFPTEQHTFPVEPR